MEVPMEVIRQANLSDYQQVMGLDNATYGGLDYLAETYKNFINDPQIICFVAQLGELVIGFISMHHLPDDKSIVSIAKRIHCDHQRRGVAHRLEADALNFAKATWPETTLHTWCSIYVPVYDKLRADPNWKVRIKAIYRTLAIWTTYEKARKSIDLLNRNPSPDETNILPIAQPKMEALLEKSALEELFPGNYFCSLHYWLPRPVNMKNLSWLLETHRIFGSMDDSKTSCIAFSVGIHLKVESTCRYVLLFYSLKKARYLAIPHVQMHAKNLLENAEGCNKVALAYSTVKWEGDEDEMEKEMIKSMFGPDVHVGIDAKALLLEEDSL